MYRNTLGQTISRLQRERWFQDQNDLEAALGSFDNRPNCPNRDSQDYGIRMIFNHTKPGIREITVQTNNRKTPEATPREVEPVRLADVQFSGVHKHVGQRRPMRVIP